MNAHGDQQARSSACSVSSAATERSRGVCGAAAPPPVPRAQQLGRDTRRDGFWQQQQVSITLSAPNDEYCEGEGQ